MPEKLTNLLDVRKSAYFDPLKDISWCHLLRYIKIKDIFGTSRSKHYIIFIKHDCTMHLNESIMRKWENTGQNRPFFGHIEFYVFFYFAATISSLRSAELIYFNPLPSPPKISLQISTILLS